MEKHTYRPNQEQARSYSQPDPRRQQLSPGTVNDLDLSPTESAEDLPIYEPPQELAAGNSEQNVAATALSMANLSRRRKNIH